MRMKIPKYIEKKIRERARYQGKANCFQMGIEEWCAKHNIELEYSGTHICLFTEPYAVALGAIEQIKNADGERREGERREGE